jgi:hypothetical protein
VGFLKEHNVYLYLYNPGDRDVNVTLQVYCSNCIEDFVFLGYKLGVTRYDTSFINVIPSFIEVENKTYYTEGEIVTVKINSPMLMKRYAELNLFGRNISIRYYAPILDYRIFDISVVATTTTITRISVVGSIEATVYGMSSTMLILVPLLTILIVTSILHFSVWKKSRQASK